MKVRNIVIIGLVFCVTGACKKRLDPVEFARLLKVSAPELRDDSGVSKGLDDAALYTAGATEEMLKANICNVHEKYWGNVQAVYGEQAAHAPEIANCSTNEPKIRLISNGVALIERVMFDNLSKGYPAMTEVWTLEKNFWKPILTATNRKVDATVVDLNGDKAMDIILNNSSFRYEIFVAKPTGGIDHVQSLEVGGVAQSDFSDNCKAWLKVQDRADASKVATVRFDCAKNRFVE